MHTKTVAAVLGAGSWGTALAIQLARNGHKVRLWGHKPEHIGDMISQRENSRYLPGIGFPQNLHLTSVFSEVVEAAALILVVVPSEGFGETISRLRRVSGTASPPLLWATKGLESGTARFLHEVVEEKLGLTVSYGVLSGPSFAREVALDIPTAVTVASVDVALAKKIASWFHSSTFRVYTSQDVIGVELGGALKNIFAIAAGISDGLGFGANARAALITRGLHEMMLLGERVGANRQTLMGLSGLGDLVLTCTDDQSRNRRMGLAVGRGESIDEAKRTIGQAVEGLLTAKVVNLLAAREGVDMPICKQVYRVLYDDLDPRQAVSELLARELKDESQK